MDYCYLYNIKPERGTLDAHQMRPAGHHYRLMIMTILIKISLSIA